MDNRRKFAVGEDGGDSGALGGIGGMAEDLAVTESERIALAEDLLWRVEGNSLTEHLQFIALGLQGAGDSILEREPQLFNLLTAYGHHLCGDTRKALTKLVNADELLRIVVDEELRYGSGRLERGMDNQINDADVARVAYAGDDRQGELGTMRGEFVCIETSEVGYGTAAADYYDYVVVGHWLLVIYGIESGNDRACGAIALHDGGEELRGETQAIGIILQLVAEVAITGSTLGRDNRYAADNIRQDKGFIQIQYAVGLKLLQGKLALACEVTQGERRVDILNVQTKAIDGVKFHGDFNKHLHARLRTLAGLLQKIGGDELPGVAPARGAHLGGEHATVGFLDEFQITVSAVGKRGYLGAHPTGVRKSLLEAYVQPGAEF